MTVGKGVVYMEMEILQLEGLVEVKIEVGKAECVLGKVSSLV